jgi:hypothetical protein
LSKNPSSRQKTQKSQIIWVFPPLPLLTAYRSLSELPATITNAQDFIPNPRFVKSPPKNFWFIHADSGYYSVSDFGKRTKWGALP